MDQALKAESLISDFYCRFENGSSEKNSSGWGGGKELVIARCTELLDCIDAADIRQANAAVLELLLFMEGKIRITASTKHLRPTFQDIQNNTALVVQCGGVGSALTYLARVLRLVHADRLSLLHSALSFAYLIIVCNMESSECSRQLARAVSEYEEENPLHLLLSVLNKEHSTPGFPTKRIILLWYAWIYTMLGSDEIICRIKRERIKAATGKENETLKSAADDLDLAEMMLFDSSYLTRYVNQEKVNVIKQHLHLAPSNLPACPTEDPEILAHSSALYHTLFRHLKDYLGLFKTILSIACASSLHAQDKQVFFSSRHHVAEPVLDDATSSDYWQWLKREKEITAKGITSILLLLLKRFRLNHEMKAEHLTQILIDNEIVQILIKFLNKDIARYVASHVDVGDFALGQIGAANRTIQVNENGEMQEYSRDHGLIVCIFLRLVLRICKHRPSVVKNTLIRWNFIDSLMRVLELPFPEIQRYAIKIVKIQTRYMGEQWIQKNMKLISFVYCNSSLRLYDPWLDPESSEPTKERALHAKFRAFVKKYAAVDEEEETESVSIALQARDELESENLVLSGGLMRRHYKELALDPVFCNTYQDWLATQVFSTDESSFEQLPLFEEE